MLPQENFEFRALCGAFLGILGVVLLAVEYNGDIMLPATRIKYALHAYMRRYMAIYP